MDNTEQRDFWTAQQSWVAHQDTQDKTIGPVLERVLSRAALAKGQRVLDIGFGTGASLLRAAEEVGPDGAVHGVDIAATLVEVARARCADMPQITLQLGDAQSDDLGGPYDACISRFGVMFFEDTPKAFANIAQALAPGALLTLGAWGPAPQNPFFMGAAKAARAVLGEMPKVDRSLPGPFAFEDAARVTRDFTAAGLTDIVIEDIAMHLTPPGTLDDFADLCLAIGPAQSARKHFQPDAAQTEALRAALKAEFAQYETDAGLHVPALINLITARTKAD